MKSSAAFALGLWTGAAVVAAVGVFYWHALRPAPSIPPLRSEADWQAKDEEIRQLRQEQARLTAEDQRLRQTNADLKNSLARAVARTEVLSRRIPFRRPETATSPEGWILDAITNADTNALPKLTAAAAQNNPFALEAVAVLADRDGAASLLQVANTFSLNSFLRAKAAQFIAAAVETSPQAEEWVRALFNAGGTDGRLLAATVSGLLAASPKALATLDETVLPSPQFQPDYALRLRLLELLPSRIEDETLRVAVAQAREELQRRVLAATPPLP